MNMDTDNRHSVVAVTGPRGLVGEAVIRRLAQSGFAVRRLSRIPLGDDGANLSILPPFDASDGAFDTALSGSTHVVHAAALTNADATASEADFMNANVRLAEKMARAARRVTPGRFILISSIRAVAGQGFPGIIDAATKSAPSCPYGRSKLAGEIAAGEIFAASAHRLSILRPAPVYGRGMKGNLGRLLRLARTPYPLPLAGFSNRRSLLDVEALARAVAHVLANPASIGGAYIASDRKPVTVAEILTAFRKGMGRPPGLFHLPPTLLEGLASLTGQRQVSRGISVEEICDSSVLEGTGWIATESSMDGLAALARPQHGAGP